jgi:hypothetical protein
LIIINILILIIKKIKIILIFFLFIFNKIEILKIFIEEAEPLCLSLCLYFIEIYYKYLIKLFVLNKDEKEILIKK